jgi:RNA polymerase sigma factor (sigma-70 family)
LISISRVLSDEVLVVALRSQEDAATAFATLYDRHFAWVVRQCRSIVDDLWDSEDLAQNVFAKLFAAPPLWCGESLRPLLRRMSMNAGISFLRRRRYELGDGDLLTEGIGDAEASAVAALEAGELLRMVRSLRPVRRAAICAYYYGRCSHSEAARDLGLPIGTLKTRVRSGLRDLRLIAEQTHSYPRTARVARGEKSLSRAG